MTPAYHIQVETFESVVPGGVRRVTWLVERDDAWLIAGEVPGALVEQQDTGPKMVWLRRVTLELAPGARLVRIESVPQQTTLSDPLAYLFRSAARSSRETRRSYFIVGPKGKLERVPPPRV